MFSSSVRRLIRRPAPANLLSSLVCSPRSAAAPGSFLSRTMASSSSPSQPILDAITARHSHYRLSKELPITASRVDELVKIALDEVPSSFNSQSNRVVVLHGAQHEKFWDIVTSTLKPIVPAEKWESTAGRMKGFRDAAGSVLFFKDQETVETMQKNVAAYADRFPDWATQTTAMLQYTLWTVFDVEGLGASLQHYNPLVDEEVAATWDLPKTWVLNAQLVFGGKLDTPGAKERKPIEARFKSFS